MKKKAGKPDTDFREKAEKMLENKADATNIPEGDLYAVIHELQVHKVELELINEELRTTRKEVENALQKLRLALETGNIGLWEMDIKNDRLFLDEGSEKIFGLKRGDRHYPSKIDDLVCEEDLILFKSKLRSTLVHEIPFEIVFRTKPGLYGSISITAKALLKKDKEGKIVTLSGVFFDITGLKKDTENLIAGLNEDLLRSNKELQDFAYVASHDLQEPLRMITSFTQLLEKQYGDKLDDKAREYISYAVEGANRMYDLLNGLLTYSRIRTRVQEFTRVDMNNVLESVKKNLHFFAGERNVIISSDNLPVIFADKNQMTQLMQNLVSNSIKFAERTPELHISATEEDDLFVFSIRDNGIGIEPQYSDKIFEMFQRLLPREKYEGTGIGLAICKRIVERHSGRIWVESEPGQGSTFFFTIPKIPSQIS